MDELDLICWQRQSQLKKKMSTQTPVTKNIFNPTINENIYLYWDISNKMIILNSKTLTGFQHSQPSSAAKTWWLRDSYSQEQQHQLKISISMDPHHSLNSSETSPPSFPENPISGTSRILVPDIPGAWSLFQTTISTKTQPWVSILVFQPPSSPAFLVLGRLVFYLYFCNKRSFD